MTYFGGDSPDVDQSPFRRRHRMDALDEMASQDEDFWKVENASGLQRTKSGKASLLMTNLSNLDKCSHEDAVILWEDTLDQYAHILQITHHLKNPWKFDNCCLNYTALIFRVDLTASKFWELIVAKERSYESMLTYLDTYENANFWFGVMCCSLVYTSEKDYGKIAYGLCAVAFVSSGIIAMIIKTAATTVSEYDVVYFVRDHNIVFVYLFYVTFTACFILIVFLSIHCISLNVFMSLLIAPLLLASLLLFTFSIKQLIDRSWRPLGQVLLEIARERRATNDSGETESEELSEILKIERTMTPHQKLMRRTSTLQDLCMSENMNLKKNTSKHKHRSYNRDSFMLDI